MNRIMPVLACALGGIVAACQPAPPNELHVGYVEAEYVYVASPQSGWIEHLAAAEGDEVDADVILFELDKDRELAVRDEARGRLAQADAQMRDLASGARPPEIAALQAQLEDAQAQLVFAQSELDRSLPLVQEGIVSEVAADRLVSERDRAQARVSSAEESIRIARLAARSAAQEAAKAAKDMAASALAQTDWTIDQRSVRSRRSGRVEKIFYREGEFVNAGAPVLALLPQDQLKVRFFVSQADLPRLGVGETVNVLSDGLPDPVSAEILFIADEAEFTPPIIYSANARQTLVFAVEARLPVGTGLHPGLPVDVDMR